MDVEKLVRRQDEPGDFVRVVVRKTRDDDDFDLGIEFSNLLRAPNAVGSRRHSDIQKGDRKGSALLDAPGNGLYGLVGLSAQLEIERNRSVVDIGRFFFSGHISAVRASHGAEIPESPGP